jgi:hypothetical protein
MPLASAFLLFSLLGSGLAALVNRTIDDQYGDSITGATPVYAPKALWTQGALCQSCGAQPDPTMVFNRTWHDSTYTVEDGQQRTITISFNGMSKLYFYSPALLRLTPRFLQDQPFMSSSSPFLKKFIFLRLISTSLSMGIKLAYSTLYQAHRTVIDTMFWSTTIRNYLADNTLSYCLLEGILLRSWNLIMRCTRSYIAMQALFDYSFSSSQH